MSVRMCVGVKLTPTHPQQTNAQMTCIHVNHSVHVYKSACAAIDLTPTHPQQTNAQMNSQRLRIVCVKSLCVCLCQSLWMYVCVRLKRTHPQYLCIPPTNECSCDIGYNVGYTCIHVNHSVHVYKSACAAIDLTPTRPQETYAFLYICSNECECKIECKCTYINNVHVCVIYIYK